MQNPSATLAALEALAVTHRFERKLLVCRRPAEGRELLRSIAARGTAWVGFEVTTLWQLAQTIVGEKLAALELQLIDEFGQAALLDQAIEQVLVAESSGRLAELAGGTGLRQAVSYAVQSLRLAGIDAAMLGRTGLRDEEKRVQLARILTAYESLLRHPPLQATGAAALQLTDVAGTFRSAVASLRVGDAAPPDGLVLLLPDLDRRGLSGQLLDALVERGARVLPRERVHGLEQPLSLLAPAEEAPAATRLAWLHAVRAAPAELPCDLELFAATSIRAELREVLRRVLAAGLRWDQVEILATDPLPYAVALDGLARRLGIPVTYATGLPLSRTRVGRAVSSYLEWVATGFPADVLRGMLERGDLAPADGSASSTRLARELRRLRVGQGRDRYLPAIERGRQALAVRVGPPDEEQPPEELAAEQLQRSAALDALAQLLAPILAASPPLPERPAVQAARVSPAALARGVLALLARVPRHGQVEWSASERVAQRLERIAHTATRELALADAVAYLTAQLDLRVPSPDAAGPAPWGAAGGHLHFSDLEQGGHTQRPAVFIVGLDAGRFPGSGRQDALLVDDDRRRLTEADTVAALPTAADRIEEKRYRFAVLLARLRGRVTLSYSKWDAVEGRALPPAAELLQAYRLLTGDVLADYERLHNALAPAASPVPHTATALDAADVWLGALAHDGTLRYGVPVVRQVYAGLDAGVVAGRALAGPVLTPWHGAVEPRPRLDARANPELVLSATQLQTLGTCPHRYLLRYVLHVRPPQDPVISTEQWLDALDRGSLLHHVYERSLTQAHERRLSVDDAAFESLVLELLAEETARARAVLPPPGEAVYALELASLREDARAFVAMVREDGPRWLLPLERQFGSDGVPAIEIELPQGGVRIRGAIDRIDRLEDGRLVVIDYKTGSSQRFGERQGPFDGGRRLQHVLYAAVARRLEGADVARVEYHFPGRRSENHRARYGPRVLDEGLNVVDRLLVLPERGLFHHTNDREDCRYCDFAAVCRVQVNEHGEVDSKRADWVRDRPLEELQLLKELRR